MVPESTPTPIKTNVGIQTKQELDPSSGKPEDIKKHQEIETPLNYSGANQFSFSLFGRLLSTFLSHTQLRKQQE